jgi:hypothetical protein
MFFRLQGWVQTPLGAAVAGADVAILDQPADFTTQPGSPLADIFSAPESNSANITAASWNAQQIQFTFDAVPDDVVPLSFIGVTDVDPDGYNNVPGSPWQVLAVNGNVVTVSALVNPGAYNSGGVVATSLLPNPLTTDGNGYYFCYTAPGLVSVQVYGPTIAELDYPDQPVGTVAGGSVLSVGLIGDGVLFASSITGSPVTSSGNFDLSESINDQTANTVFAGPLSGSAAPPTFRAIDVSDLPSGLGTVTSVALAVTVPTSVLGVSISGSPVTASGTLGATITLVNQAANTFFAGPTSGASSAPGFRAIAPEDLPGAVLSSVAVTLTSAQIKALHATPVQILAAQGANTAVIPIEATFQYKFGTVAYTNAASADIVIGPTAMLGTAEEPIQIQASDFIDTTSNQLAFSFSDSTGPQASYQNAALFVANEQGTGEFGTGDGTLVVTMWYLVLTLS